MRKLPIIFTVLLTVAWAYTCWYWYTCNIKGFCDEGGNHIVHQSVDNSNHIVQETVENKQDETETGSSGEEEIVLEDIKDSPKLSAEDVLFDPLPKEIEDDSEKENIEIEENVDKEETEENKNDLTQSGTILKNTKDEEISENTQENQEVNICKIPLVGPISLGGNNNATEVKKLEAFLVSRGESTNNDGVYDATELEAVKRFQLEYKEDVLDPWDITIPTGYVGKTSIAKINEIACK